MDNQTQMYISDDEIDRLLGTLIPGGSQARDWFLPHESERGLSNVRDVVRRILNAAQASTEAPQRQPLTTPLDLCKVNEFLGIASLLDEAADNISGLMDTAEAERLQVRHWLPDELSGSALILREYVSHMSNQPPSTNPDEETPHE